MNINDVRKVYSGRTPGAIGMRRYYSVLVPFCEVPEGTDLAPELSVLYEVRSGEVSQPGEVCFPGGQMEEGETAEECAVRETCEELGVTADAIEVIGQGDTLYGNGNFTLYTFIGKLDFDAYVRSEHDPEEVKETFLITIDELTKTSAMHYGEEMKPVIEESFPYEKVGISRDYPWRTPFSDIPVYDIDGRIIWGMTGRITENVMENLL